MSNATLEPQPETSYTPEIEPDAYHRSDKVWIYVGLSGVFFVCSLLICAAGWFALLSFGSAFAPATPTRKPVSSPVIPENVTISKKDGAKLHYVPAGEFTMGSAFDASLALCHKIKPTCGPDSFKDETPAHKLSLDAFWIDETEVTNRRYARCVAVGACSPPRQKALIFIWDYYEGQQYANYPVLQVPWGDAQAYCAWAGRELPTEAQWEKAARGVDGRAYPWGNDLPNATLSNYNRVSTPLTEKVGHFPPGASPYGVLDMAGNVWEWVSDWYDVYPGGDASASPDFGQQYRVVRGGASLSDSFDIRATIRDRYDPDRGYDIVGFRCALPAP